MPDVHSLLWGISDDDKEDAACGHSERLALTCALNDDLCK